MSYDLYLKPRNDEIGAEDVLSFLSESNLYDVHRGQAFYENEDTGVYFFFERNEPLDEEFDEDEDGEEEEFSTDDYSVAFNVNLLRPSYFALEAEKELSRVVSRFDLSVLDPQTNGIEGNEYDPDRFIQGWNSSNRFGVRSILSMDDDRPEVYSMPRAKLEFAWRWNYGRKELQDKLGESIFVPQIMFFLIKGDPVTAVVWSDAIPMAFPEAAYIAVYRDEYAPRRWFRGRESSVEFVPWADIEGLVRSVTEEEGEALLARFEEPPNKVDSFFRSLKSTGISAERVDPALVIDEELFDLES
ncbi:MAG TPA: hypothetical protein VMM38_03460 [Aridibacter sp.]|nr:hypothetical protein [Aridibacter sp.]